MGFHTIVQSPVRAVADWGEPTGRVPFDFARDSENWAEPDWEWESVAVVAGRAPVFAKLTRR